MSAIKDARAALVRLDDPRHGRDWSGWDYADDLQRVLRGLVAEYERLTTPPTDDEREALIRREEQGYDPEYVVMLQELNPNEPTWSARVQARHAWLRGFRRQPRPPTANEAQRATARDLRSRANSVMSSRSRAGVAYSGIQVSADELLELCDAILGPDKGE